MVCKKCGAELQEDAMVCEACGAAIENEEIETVEVTEAEDTEVVVNEEASEESVVDEMDVEETEEVETVNVTESNSVVADSVDILEGEGVVEESPAKKSAFVRIGIPVIIVAVIAIACVVAMLVAKRGNNIIARAEYKAPEVTAGPSGEPGTAQEFKYFDEDVVVKIDEQLYSYYAGQILGSMQNTYAQYGMSVDASMVESMYDTQIHQSALDNAKVVRLFEMKADEYKYELSEELKTDSESQLKEYVESLVNTEAGETYESSKDEIIRKLYGISHDDFLEAFLRVNRVAEFLENYPEVPEITEEMMKESYESYKDVQFTSRKVKHILISTMGESGKELSKRELKKKKELADKLAKQINNGANIDELIKKHTDDVDAEGNPNNNGEYEVAGDGSYVAEFEDWAMSHSTEDKAEVVKTSYGYHVMKMSVYEVTPYEEAKGVLRGMFVSQEGSLLAQAMEITHENEEVLKNCKAQLVGTLPTPAPAELPAADATASVQ